MEHLRVGGSDLVLEVMIREEEIEYLFDLVLQTLEVEAEEEHDLDQRVLRIFRDDQPGTGEGLGEHVGDVEHLADVALDDLLDALHEPLHQQFAPPLHWVFLFGLVQVLLGRVLYLQLGLLSL